MITRRRMMSTPLALAILAACQKSLPKVGEPGGGWVVTNGPKVIGHALSGRTQISTRDRFTLESKFRIASITKLVVGLAIGDWAKAGKLDVSAPVADVLPDTPPGLTLAHLLAHQSGLRDPEVYWADVKTDIRTLYSRADFTHPPGTYFRYANLNYGLAATVVEARLGERFDLLMWRWLTSHGIDAGLNWSGISMKSRQQAAAAYRQIDGVWTPTVDARGDVPLVSPTYLGRETTQLTDYVPGTNGTLFSPQGGMRMSLMDLISIGHLLQERPAFRSPVWTDDGTNADTEDGHFLSFGPANYIYTADTSPIPGVPLVGHLGEAYGVQSGLFIVPDTSVIFAFAQLGTASEAREMTGQKTGGGANQSVHHQVQFDALAPTVRAAL